MKVARYLKKWLPSLLIAVGAVSAQAQTVEYIHTDALGTPVAVTNSAGVVIERSEYEPYGQLLNRPLTDGPGFTGHVQDAATGLTYMQQRYYDPGIGRFLSVDPINVDGNTGAKFNRYMYALNNPYKFTDPDGRDDNSIYGDPSRMMSLPADITPDQAMAAINFEVAVLTGGVSAALRAVAAPFVRGVAKDIVAPAESPIVAGVPVGKSPSESRAALEGAGYKGTKISNESGTESGTLHNVPEMKMDVRVMNGGPKHAPRVSTTRQGNPRQPVNPADGKNFGNIPKGEQRTGSHIYYRRKD